MASKRARQKIADQIEDLSNQASACLLLVKAVRPKTAHTKKLIKALDEVEGKTVDLENLSYEYYQTGK